MQRTGKPIQCAAFLAQLGALLETAGETQLLQRWDRVGIPYSGRIGVEHVMDMELEYETLRHQLPFLSEEDCHRLNGKIAQPFSRLGG